MLLQHCRILDLFTNFHRRSVGKGYDKGFGIDDAALCPVPENMLLNNGFEVVGEAENGAIGIKIFGVQTGYCYPDITMPEMDGLKH